LEVIKSLELVRTVFSFIPEIEMNLSISMLNEMTKSQNFGLTLSGYKVAAGLAERKERHPASKIVAESHSYWFEMKSHFQDMNL